MVGLGTTHFRNTLPSYLSPFVRVIISNGIIEAIALALLDSGSEATLISSSLASVLQLKSSSTTIRFSTLQSTRPIFPLGQTSFTIQSVDKRNSFLIRKAFIVEELNVNKQSFAWSTLKNCWSHLQDLPLEDFNSEQVGLFLGVNTPGVLKQLETRESSYDSGPMAILTPFGWTVIGEIAVTPSISHPHVLQLAQSSPLSPFWLKSVSYTTKERSTFKATQEEEAWELMRSMIRLVDGHYELGLLWTTPTATVPDNRAAALRTMYANEARCRRDPIYKERIIKGVEMYEKMGFSRKLSPSELRGIQGRTFYLPYHIVEHPYKPDKPRLVFNASYRQNGQSLNDVLHTKPDLITPLSTVLIRFRENPFAVCMDIVKMFLQVRVRKEDQSCLRYIYRRPGSSGPPETFQMMVQIFGGGSSMTACIFAMRQTALDNPGFEDVAQKLVDCFYIDNYADSYTTADAATAGCLRLVKLLSLGGFELSQISSCSREVLSRLSISPCSSQTLNLAFDDLPTERTLGLQWDCEADSFKFLLNNIALPKTKRELSSYVGRFFDPLGFIVCVLMPLRIVLQDVWRSERNAKSSGNQSWDRTLCADHILRLKEITDGFPNLVSLRIRRCIFPVQSCDSVLALHIFCDASLAARGAVAYLQATTNQTTTVTIIQARGKVTPLDPETIPHQEFISCKIGAELYSKISATLRLKVDKVFFWTDSQAVLYWIKKENSNQPHYVNNLRNCILSKTNPLQWRYVPSSLNPADYITKGIKAKDFTSTHRFILGPEFLLHPSDVHWPQQPFPIAPLSLDIRTLPILQDSIAVDHLINTATSLTELKLSIANAKAGSNNSPRCPAELHSALLLAVKEVQSKSFPEEFKLLTSGKSFQRSSRLRKLIPLLGEDGVIRVGGRLNNADALTETTKHPIILPPEGKLTELVVLDAHLRLLHSSTTRTHYEVRATYWILRGEQVVGRIIHRCEQCRRQYAPLLQPRMASLPRSRVTAYKPVFYNTGIDLLGPFNVPVKRSIEKRWVTLFTCLDTRALHLEITTDLSASAFLNAFTCFSSLRGRPRFVFSDNGTNLVAGDRKLSEGLARVLEEPGIVREFADQGITWRFNPAAAPHWGGAWERLVRSVKTALKAALGERSVKEDVLRTTLAEVASLINGRPLTHLGVDPDDQRPITPNHFLIGRENRNTPHDVFEEARGDLDRDRWTAAQQLTELCWRRWLHEYLPGMTERSKWTKEQRNLEKNDVVLVLDNRAPRGQWVTGIVFKTFPGDDKIVRSVLVDVEGRIFRRPVTSLCLLKAVSEGDSGVSELNSQQGSSQE